jgi:hypothetical protein
MWSDDEVASLMAFEIASRTTFRTVMRSRLMSLMSGVELTSEQRATMTVMAQLARLRSFFVSALEGEACSARLVQQTRSWIRKLSVAVRGFDELTRLSFPARRRPIVRKLEKEEERWIRFCFRQKSVR